LVSCQEAEFVSRVNKLYLEPPTVRTLEPDKLGSGPPKWELPPKPQKLEAQVASMAVTGFKDYLACPYRFYLSRILKLETVDDAILEMDGLLFGNLGHTVLALFAKSDEACGSDYEKSNALLSQILEQAFLDKFGTKPLPATVIQREQLRKRLAPFAKWHCEFRAAGWVTKEIEYKPELKATTFIVDGEPFVVEGRIDRIDYHPIKKSWAVFDYKLGDKTEEPQKTHVKADEWIDLQLPLYYHLLRNAGFEGEIKLGYIRLCPGVPIEEMVSFCEWSEDDLNNARQCAIEIIKKVRNQIFWPPSKKIKYSDRFSAILGTSQFFEGEDDDAVSS